MNEVETFKSLEEGDRILFNDRQVPLEVAERDDNRLHVNGPQGGEYIVFKAEEQERLLIAPKGRRSYAAYLDDLREVGKWMQDGNSWEHSKTGATVELVENEIGRWTVETSMDADFSPPKYGYADKESAVEDAEKLVEKNPEGTVE